MTSTRKDGPKRGGRSAIMTDQTENPIPTSVRDRLTATLFTSESFFSAATIASSTIMPIVASDLSGRESLAGFPSTMLLIGQAVAAYPLGRLMDRFGRRRGLSLGYFVASLGAVLAAFAIGWGAFIGFCLGVGLFGVGRAGGLQARFAAAEIRPPSQRARAIGTIVFAGTIGAIFGPLLAGPASRIAVRYGFDAQTGPYMMAAFFFYIAFFLTFMLLRPDPMDLGTALAAAEAEASGDEGSGRSSAGSNRAVVRRSLRAIFAGPSVRLALMAMIIGQLVMTMIMVITPLYMKSLGYGIQEISLVIMAHTLGMFALSSVTGWLIDRHGRLTMIVAGALILALASVMAPLFSLLVILMAALFLLGLGWNFCFIAGSSLLTDSFSADERGRTQGTNDMMVALASGAGSLSTGALYAFGGMGLIAAIGLGFAVALILFTGWSTRQIGFRAD